MSNLYLRSIDRRWKKEIALAEDAIIFLSPYLTSNTADLVLRKANPKITRVCTVFAFQNFVSGGSSIRTIRQLKNRGIQLFYLEKLHAKVLIVDSRFASLGSQNLTFGGTRNKEASIVISKTEQIMKLKELVESWLLDAIPISDEMIAKAEELVNALQEKTKPIFIEIADVEQQYWYELKLQEMQRQIPKVRQTLKRYTRSAGIRSIDKETARFFIRKSAYWLRHPSGYAARAPRHQDNVYDSYEPRLNPI